MAHKALTSNLAGFYYTRAFVWMCIIYIGDRGPPLAAPGRTKVITYGKIPKRWDIHRNTGAHTRFQFFFRLVCIWDGLRPCVCAGFRNRRAHALGRVSYYRKVWFYYVCESRYCRCWNVAVLISEWWFDLCVFFRRTMVLWSSAISVLRRRLSVYM